MVKLVHTEEVYWSIILSPLVSWYKYVPDQ